MTDQEIRNYIDRQIAKHLKKKTSAELAELENKIDDCFDRAERGIYNSWSAIRTLEHNVKDAYDKCRDTISLLASYDKDLPKIVEEVVNAYLKRR